MTHNIDFIMFDVKYIKLDYKKKKTAVIVVSVCK